MTTGVNPSRQADVLALARMEQLETDAAQTQTQCTLISVLHFLVLSPLSSFRNVSQRCAPKHTDARSGFARVGGDRHS